MSSRPSIPTPYSIEIITSPTNATHILDFWRSHSSHPNLHPDFSATIAAARKTTLVLIVATDSLRKSRGLLVGRIASEPLKYRVAYTSFSFSQIRTITILYPGIVGDTSTQCADALVTALNGFLARGGADLVTFEGCATESELFHSISRLTPALLRDHLIDPQRHWTTDLSSGLLGFTDRLSKKHRYWVRRIEKRATVDLSPIQFKTYKRHEDLSPLLSDIESIARTTYHRKLAAGFCFDDEQRERYACEARNGWLRIYVMYARGAPSAFWIGSVYNGTFYSSSTGYNPSLRHYELGTLVFMRMVSDLCNSGVTTLDYGFGDALYKQRFGDDHWSETGLRMYAPTRRGIILSVTQLLVHVPSRGAQLLVRKLGLEQRIKTFLRKRL